MLGAALGPFRLVRRIDQGGMGQVWRGEHARSGLPVAIKLVREDKPEFVSAFFDEVRAVARLDHPNVIAVLDCGRIEPHAVAASKGALSLGAPWFAMEFCGGGQLSTENVKDWATLRGALQALLRALAYAHSRGVLHRDLTPENVLLAAPDDARPGLKLSDFGLGPAICANLPKGTVVGTPAYMAPEQFGNDPAAHGAWTDLYALGCVGWAMASGSPPFGQDRPPSVLALAHRELDLPRLAPRFSLPPGVEHWLARLLEKEPGRRFRHAAEASAALAALDGGEPPARGVPVRWRADDPTSRPVRLVDAGLGLWSLRPPPFVGRSKERDRLWSLLRGVASDGSARLVHLTGPTGVGRSRIARWLAERACEFAGVGSVVGSAGQSLDAVQRRVRATLREPLVVVLDDAHADPDLVALAAAILRQRAGSPILVVLTTRSDALAAAPDAAREISALMATPVATRMELAPLSTSDEYSFLKLGLGLGANLSERVRERAAGNPAYAVMLVGEAVTAATLVAGSDGLDLPAGEPIAMPNEARKRWTAEIERALGAVGARPDGTSRIALEAAAALGVQVDEAEWNGVCQRLGIRPPTALVERLVRERFAIPARSSEGRTEPGDALSWQFAHAQLRDALVAGAAEAGRLVLLHRACAATLSAGRRGQPGVTERIGRHLHESGDHADAAGWLVRGARKSLGREDVRAASALLGMAELSSIKADVSPDDERLGLIRTLRAVVRIHGGDRAAGASEIERVIEIAPGHGWQSALAEALLARADLHRRATHADAAMAALGRVRAIAAAQGDDALDGRAMIALGQLALELGERGRATGLAEQAADAARRCSERRLLAEALALASEAARQQGDYTRAEFTAKEALNVAIKIPHRAAIGAARVVLAETEREAGRFDRATTQFQQAIATLEELGSPEVVVPVFRLAAMLLATERAAEAALLLAAARREARRHGLRGWRAAIDALAACVAVERGEFGEVDELLEAAGPLASGAFVDGELNAALISAAALLIEQGGRPETAARMRELGGG
jgi:tetratricopeptide (TPR) repeat protein